MARISLLNEEALSGELQERFRRIRENGGRVLNLYKVMAHSPKIGHYFLRLGSAILLEGMVLPNLRELAILRVGLINKANYEWTQHVPIALRAGVKQSQIDALSDWENSAEFNDMEKSILRYTDEETVNIKVADETFAAVRKFLSEEGIVELTTVIGYYSMVCRILETLQVELES
jgi:alkylhydroperoxidase family enzyme